jgi:hypothetical protein
MSNQHRWPNFIGLAIYRVPRSYGSVSIRSCYHEESFGTPSKSKWLERGSRNLCIVLLYPPKVLVQKGILPPWPSSREEVRAPRFQNQMGERSDHFKDLKTSLLVIEKVLLVISLVTLGGGTLRVMINAFDW